MKQSKPIIAASEGVTVCVADRNDFEGIQRAVYGAVKPVAMERCNEKMSRLGRPLLVSTDPDAIFVQGYVQGFCDAVYFMLTGQLNVGMVYGEDIAREIEEKKGP